MGTPTDDEVEPVDEKRLAEDFRLRQHGGPHPLLARDVSSTAAATAAAPVVVAPPPPALTPSDARRVVVHFDVDAFYCQVEELRDPRLRERPTAVTQKYLIVTVGDDECTMTTSARVHECTTRE